MINQEQLKNILNYNPILGIFTWLKPKRGRKKSGLVGGGSAGYIQLQIDGKRYPAHRMAWLYIHGDLPVGQIDHINHDIGDNRITNLRSVTHQENGKNQLLSSRNNSGVCGISWCKTYLKWVAQVTADGKNINLGRFDDKFEAICARMSANNKYGFHVNHGSTK